MISDHRIIECNAFNFNEFTVILLDLMVFYDFIIIDDRLVVHDDLLIIHFLIIIPNPKTTLIKYNILRDIVELGLLIIERSLIE